MKILINFATRTRPTKFFKCLDNIREMSVMNNYLVLVKADNDDITMNNPEVRDRVRYYPEVQVEWGWSKNKVHAINRGVGAARTFWNILVNLSDDQLFVTKGFDKIITEDFEKYYPDKDAFLHYPDSHTWDKIPTMSVMGRKYYERDFFVYEPSFMSVYGDNYAMEVAKRRGRYRFIPTTIYDHFHYRWGLAEKDDQYLKTDNKEVYAKDSQTLLKLKMTLQ